MGHPFYFESDETLLQIHQSIILNITLHSRAIDVYTLLIKWSFPDAQIPSRGIHLEVKTGSSSWSRISTGGSLTNILYCSLKYTGNGISVSYPIFGSWWLSFIMV